MTCTHPFEDAVEALNYLESIPWVIDSDVLKDFNNNFPIYLKKYLEKSNFHFEDILVFGEKDSSVTIKTFENFLNKNDKYLNTLKAELKLRKASSANWKENDNKNLIASIFKEKERLEEKYRTVIIMVVEFIKLYKLAKLYEGKTLYFCWIFDSRGRAYALGYLLYLMGDKLAKSVLNIKYDEPNEEGSIKKSENFEAYIKSTTKSEKVADWFTQRKIICCDKKLINIQYGIDASAQGPSLLSAVSGCINGLKLSNVLVPTDSMDDKKIDPYKEVINEMELLIEKESELKTTVLYYLGQRFCKQREIIKGWTMKYGYSQGKNARIDQLKEWISVVLNEIKELYEQEGIYDFNSNSPALNPFLDFERRSVEHKAVFLNKLDDVVTKVGFSLNSSQSIFEEKELKTEILKNHDDEILFEDKFQTLEKENPSLDSFFEKKTALNDISLIRVYEENKTPLKERVFKFWLNKQSKTFEEIFIKAVAKIFPGFVQTKDLVLAAFSRSKNHEALKKNESTLNALKEKMEPFVESYLALKTYNLDSNTELKEIESIQLRKLINISQYLLLSNAHWFSAIQVPLPETKKSENDI